jgi:hypothetical protein
MCKNMVEQTVPTRWSAKTVTLRCGSTSIYGDTLLCEECIAAGVPNPPAWQREDAGEADFEPYHDEEWY